MKKLISFLVSTVIATLLTWAILQVGVKDTWTLTKGVFASEEKIMEQVPKIEEIDNKLKKSIVKKPLNWLSEKHEKQIAKEVLKGNLSAITNGIRTYAGILIAVWLLVWGLIYTIFYYLVYWIISRFIRLELTLSERRV